MSDFAVWLVICLVGGAPALPPIMIVDETEYDYVATMPAYGGELSSSQTWHDARTGLAARKRIFTSGINGLVLSTHVVEAACGSLPADAAPFIVAFQFGATAPQSRAAATLSAVFIEVYVRDPAGDIRLYQEMTARQMAEMTRRLQPDCRGL